MTTQKGILMPLYRESIHETYLRLAQVWASKRAYATRKQVGVLIVKDNQIISDGYNGMPSGFPHEEMEKLDENGNLVTSPLALHAEMNAITKLARSTQSGKDGTMYCTVSPCKECAKLIIATGIKEVYYLEVYRDTLGIETLARAGIPAIQIVLKD